MRHSRHAKTRAPRPRNPLRASCQIAPSAPGLLHPPLA
jgi:hypothetical protein